MPHGLNGYCNYRCRCVVCKAAMRERNRKAKPSIKRATARAKFKTPPGRVHGTLNGYSYWGCRCDLCRAAQRAEYDRIKTLRAGHAGSGEG